MFKRFLLYIDKVFDFGSAISRISDTRLKPQISTQSVLLSVFTMALSRLGSLNAMKVELRLPKKLDALIAKKPGIDTIGRVFTKINPDDLRRWHWNNCYQLKRNKALNTQLPLNAIGVDGHEFFSHKNTRLAEFL